MYRVYSVLFNVRQRSWIAILPHFQIVDILMSTLLCRKGRDLFFFCKFFLFLSNAFDLVYDNLKSVYLRQKYPDDLGAVESFQPRRSRAR